jgi:hypothetical protein
MIEEIFTRGSYLTPPTSGNMYRRDIFELTREVDYEVWTDGVSYLACPFFGEVITLNAPLALYRMHETNQSMMSRLSVERFKHERRRVHARLEHLRRILPPEHSCKVPTAGFLYHSYEKLALECVAEGRRPDPGLVLSAIKALFREQKSPLQRLLFACWLIILGTSPGFVRTKVAIWRASPSGRSRLLQVLRAISR